MRKPLLLLLIAAALGGLSWWGYRTQHSTTKPLEIVDKAGAVIAPASSLTAPDKSAPARIGAPGNGPGNGSGTGGPGAGPKGPIGVEVAKAEQIPLADEIVAVGNLRANESVVMKPEIAGRIDSINFVDGARVTKGAMLVRLDASLVSAEVEQAKAELELSQANYQRTADLAQRNFVSGSALDQAQANLKIQQAKLQLAQAKLVKSDIRAPFTGVLGLRNVSLGDFVKEGAELVVLEDIASMKVDLRLPERYLGQLKRGQSLQLSVDAYPGRTFLAKLDAIDAQVDANGRALLVRGRLSNPEGILRSGMFAKAKVVLQLKSDAIVVPEEALIPIGNETFVYRIDAGKAIRTKVSTGIRRDGKVEVLGNLAAGDLIVTAGHQKLSKDGIEVRYAEPGRRPGPTSAGIVEQSARRVD